MAKMSFGDAKAKVIEKNGGADGADYIPVANVLNKEIEIKDVDFENKTFGERKTEMVRLYTNLGVISSGSITLVEQSRKYILPALEAGDTVTTRIVQYKTKNGFNSFKYE